MDKYDPLLLRLAAPLVFVDLETPIPISDKIKHSLRRSLDINNVDSKVWDNCIILNRLSRAKYRFQYQKCEKRVKDGNSKISPFCPESDLFPNGIISVNWFEKYMKDIPFAVVTVYQLTEDASHDIRIINDINDAAESMKLVDQTSILVVLDHSERDRMEKIKQVTHTRTLFLVENSEELAKDTDILVASLINSLKLPAHSFYSALETKIRNRYSKLYAYHTDIENIDTRITLSPKILEARNLVKQSVVSQFSNMQNLEPSIRLLESSYQAQITLLRQHISVFQDSPTDHDRHLYFQLRTTIDVTAFHIVRAHLSLEDPITALKKHQAHILNVKDIVKLAQEKNWESIQYEWLADLLSLVPDSIFQAMHQSNSKKAPANQKLLHFFGGFQVYDKNMTVITELAFIYSKAYDCLKSISAPELDRIYLACEASQSGLTKKRVNLLESALSTLSTNAIGIGEDGGYLLEDELMKEEDYKHFVAYLNWQIAQEYLNMSEDTTVLVKASHLLRTALMHFHDYHWNVLKEKIIEKLIDICIKLDNNEEVLNLAVRLLQMNLISPIKHFDFQFPSEVNLDVKLPFFNPKVLLAPMSGNQDIRINDECITQIQLFPAIRKKTLLELFPDSEFSLVLDELKVDYTRIDGKPGSKSFSPVVFANDLSLSTARVNDCKISDYNSINLAFEDDDFKVIKYSQFAENVGHHKVQSIKMQSSLVIKNNMFTLNLKSNHENNLDQKSVTFAALFLLIGHPTNLRLNGRIPHSIKVSPLVPDVAIEWECPDLTNIAVGEKIRIPLSVEYKKPPKHAYNSIKLQANVGLTDTNSRLSTRSYWENLKDDESLSLDVGKSEVILFVSLIGPSHLSNAPLGNVTISLKVLIVDDDEDGRVSENENDENNADGAINDSRYDLSVVVEPISMVFDVEFYSLSILAAPFNAKFVILPRYRAEPGTNDMPVPFILDDKTHDSKSYSMPAVTRVWLGSLSILEPMIKDIKIEDIRFTMTTNNSDMIISACEDTNKVNSETNFTELFLTRSKMGFSHRNVMIQTNAVLKYSRSNTPGIVNEYQTRSWDIVLPLSDPRVLVMLSNHDVEAKTVSFKYIIENPSPRVFTFNTELQLDELTSSTWTIEETSELPPLKQMEMPVMPFNRHVIVFRATYNDSKHLLPLPIFKVYDVHYHVWLPTLSVDSSLFIYNKRLHWQQQQQLLA